MGTPVGRFVISLRKFFFQRHNDPITVAVGNDDEGAMYGDIIDDCDGMMGNEVDNDGDGATGYDDDDGDGH